MIPAVQNTKKIGSRNLTSAYILNITWWSLQRLLVIDSKKLISNKNKINLKCIKKIILFWLNRRNEK
jgi:hypothetical protein